MSTVIPTAHTYHQQFLDRRWEAAVARQAKIAQEIQASSVKFSVITTIPQGNAGFRVAVDATLNGNNIGFTIPYSPKDRSATSLKTAQLQGHLSLVELGANHKSKVINIPLGNLNPAVQSTLKAKLLETGFSNDAVSSAFKKN